MLILHQMSRVDIQTARCFRVSVMGCFRGSASVRRAPLSTISICQHSQLRPCPRDRNTHMHTQRMEQNSIYTYTYIYIRTKSLQYVVVCANAQAVAFIYIYIYIFIYIWTPQLEHLRTYSAGLMVKLDDLRGQNETFESRSLQETSSRMIRRC